MYNWPKSLDTEQSTTYKSKGVHKNRDSTAKMQLESKDREGRTDAEIAAEQTAANMTEKVTPKNIGVDEPVKIAKHEKDVTQEQQKAVNKTSAANVSRVKAGGWRLPYPGMGDRSSFGDGPPAGNANNINQEEKYQMAASIMESNSGGGGQMSGMMGGMSGGGGGGSGAQGAVGAMSGQIGNDIAAMDDEIDQATEALFQDDSVGEAHRALGEKLQGR